MSKKQIKEEKLYDWLIYPKTYFLVAKILCNFLSNERIKKNYLTDDTNNNHKKYRFEESFDYLIMPIIYSFKHGIELYLKGISGNIDRKYNKNHDIKALINSLRCKIEENETVKGELKKLEKLINKYYDGTYIPNIKSNPDTCNTSERYPQGLGYEIPQDFFLKNSIDLGKINKDIEKALSILREKIYIPLDKGARVASSRQNKNT